MPSLILAHLLSILLVGGLRLGPSAVVPGAGRAVWLALVAVVSAGLCAALVRDARLRRAPWQRPGQALLWLVFPGAAAVSWGLGRSALMGGPELPALAFLFGLVVAALARRRTEWAGRERSGRAWTTALRWAGLPTLAGVVLLLTRETAGASGTAIALATYPLYAALQLGAALLLPWTQWERDGIRTGHRVVGAALLFGLVHWPNPLVALATAAGMLLWAGAWRAGSAFVPLALSMGILATAVTRALPESTTGHMRVSAGYVLEAHDEAQEREIADEARRIDAAAAWSAEEGLRPWLGRALAEALGEPVAAPLVDATAIALERMHRASTLRWIFESGEFRDRNRIGERLHEDELRFFDSTFVPFHPAHAPYGRLVSAGEGMTTRAYLDLAYRELLGRPISEGEYRHWPDGLPEGTRVRFLRRILRERGLRSWRLPGFEPARDRIRERRSARSR